MTETITPRRFHEVDWRVVRNDACAHFRTGSFAAGVALVDAIGGLADATDHHPDVDLRSDGVTVRLRTHSSGGLSEREVALAQEISAAARELGVPVDPTVAADRPDRDRRARHPRCDAVLARRARLPGGGRRGPDRSPLPGAAGLVPADGRAAPAAQPDPHRRLRARTTKRRRASRRRLPLVATSSVTRTRPSGGPWPTPRATRSMSPPGRTSTEAIWRAIGSTGRGPGWRFRAEEVSVIDQVKRRLSAAGARGSCAIWTHSEASRNAPLSMLIRPTPGKDANCLGRPSVRAPRHLGR